MNHLYILGTLVLTVYGQLIIKWRLSNYGSLPLRIRDRFIFLLKLLLDPFILSGFVGAFLAALFWMSALKKFDLGRYDVQ